MKLKRIGFFSGTFDPVHNGHIEFALEAISRFKLHKVVLLPEEQPRGKSSLASFEDRKEMLHLATKHYNQLEVATLPQKTFTIKESLPVLYERESDADLMYLCGSDIVKTFEYRWEGLDTLLKSVPIIIGLRQDETSSIVDNIMKKLPKGAGWFVIDSPKNHLASTHIRMGRREIDDLHPLVASYILRNNLYSLEDFEAV